MCEEHVQSGPSVLASALSEYWESVKLEIRLVELFSRVTAAKKLMRVRLVKQKHK